MRTGIMVLGLVLSGCYFGWLGGEGAESTPTDTAIAWKDLPPPFDGDKYRYRVDPYIHAASALKALGKEKACRELTRAARAEENEGKVIVLCRMIFTEMNGRKFERPIRGGACFMGKTSYSDWPREPIELVDGVPFLITRDYILAGQPVSASEYLEYCMKEWDWNSYGYKEKNDVEKKKALDHLLSSSKWKARLDEADREFLASQIE